MDLRSWKLTRLAFLCLLASLALSSCNLSPKQQTSAASPLATAGASSQPPSTSSPTTSPAASSSATETPTATRSSARPSPSAVVTQVRQRAEFASPTKNINCAMFEDGVQCDVYEQSWKLPPRPEDCDLVWGSGVNLDASGASLACSSDPLLATDEVLEYGSAVRVGRFVCGSDRAGMRCEDTSSGRGFIVSRSRYRLLPAGPTGGSSEPVTTRPSEPALTLYNGELLGVEFEQDAREILGRLREVLGDETNDRTLACDSGADRLVSWDNFYIVLDDDRFVGWSFGTGPEARPRAGRLSGSELATGEGLRVGDTVGRAAELYGRAWAVEETSLGQEWFVENAFSGSLDESGRRIASISAGDNCAFR